MDTPHEHQDRDIAPHDPRGPRLVLAEAPPDHVSQQIAKRRAQKQIEELRSLAEMDGTLARLRRHRNGHAARIRQHARDNHLELDDYSLLSASQRALQQLDLALRALTIMPEHYASSDALKRDLLDMAGYAEDSPMVASACGLWRAWALLIAQESDD